MRVAAAVGDGVTKTTVGGDAVVCAVVVAAVSVVAALAVLNIQDGRAPPLDDEEVTAAPDEADDCADSLLLVSRAVTL